MPGQELQRRPDRGATVRQRLVRQSEFDYTNVARSNDQWPDHRLRTLVTASAIAWVEPRSVLDPACGDGSILTAALRLRPIDHVYLNDISTPNIDTLKIAAGLTLAMAGAKLSNLPAQELLETITGEVDLIVLTEILEHLDDPDALLRLAATKARFLVASSPEMRPGQVDQNPEHLWMFDRDGYRGMLAKNGWRIVQYTHLNFPSEYDFQIWVAERA